jgi:predicted transposase YbfD/YdcC
VSLKEEQVCIDGKTLRGALSGNGKSNLHILHAYAHNLGMLIGQEKVADKSNEIVAIPSLLERLDIRGATVTIDAAGCQKKILDMIKKGGGHYVIALKKNQGNLYNEVTRLFTEAEKQGFEYVMNCDFYESIEKRSGRIDRRNIAIIGDPSEISISSEWPSVQTYIEVTRETTSKGKTRSEKRYYISDLIESAEKFGKVIRAHWGVESLHWLLDVVFREDESQANTLHAAENLGTLRRAAINLVKRTPHLKTKGMAKLKREAKWNEDGSVFKEICEALFSVKFV